MSKKLIHRELLIPITKMPESMKDGRLVMLYSNGVHWGCHWEKGGWFFGDDQAPHATHFTFPKYTTEQFGSGI